MSELKLIAPSIEYGADIMAFRREIAEARDSDSFLVVIVCGFVKRWKNGCRFFIIEKSRKRVRKVEFPPIPILLFGIRIIGLLELLI